MSDTYPYPDGHAILAPPAPDRYPAPEPYLSGPTAPVDSAVDNEVVVDLDAYQNPNKKKPFGFVHDGRKWRMRDPGEVDWQQQWEARRDPRLMMRLLIDPGQRDGLFSREMPNEKLTYLMGQYREHYGLDANPTGDQPL